MNKFRNIFIIATVMLSLVSYSQEPTNMALPNSPAFSILDYEPAAVMKPTNNKDLAADVLNSFDKKGNLLMNLGMEVTPYWLKSNPTLNRKDYLNPSLGQCFLQSLNISAATVKDSAKGENKLGLGFRFKLVNGKPLDDLEIKERELQEKQLKLKSTVSSNLAFIGISINTRAQLIESIKNTLTNLNYDSDVIKQFISNTEILSSEFSDTSDDLRKFIVKIIDKIDEKGSELVKEVNDLNKKRLGFILEFAGASSFITNVNADPVEKMGLWLNASNYMSKSDSWTATARYLFTNKDSVISSADLGLSYLKELPNVNISIEGLARWYSIHIPDINIKNEPITRVESGFTYRLAVQGSYKIASNISLNLSFGKNFDSPLITNYSFFSIFGITYSMYKPEKINLLK